MVKILCNRCKEELHGPGGLLFSPPNQNNQVEKIHLCLGCWIRVLEFMFRGDTGRYGYSSDDEID